jgi:hypothetical protein
MAGIKKTIFPTDVWVDDWSDLKDTISTLGHQLMQVNFDPMKLTTLESRIFLRRLLESSREYAKSIGYTNGYILFGRAWARGMTEPTHFIPNHSHGGSWMVGTFYFTEGQGDICFIDPRGAQDFYRGKVTDYRGEEHGNCTDFYYTPQSLHAILFPAYLTHMVMPQLKTESTTSRLRIAISWNLQYEEFENPGWDPSVVIKI